LPIKDSYIQGGKADPYVVLRKGHGEVLLGKSSCVSALILEPFEPPKPGEYMGEENMSLWVYNGKNNYQKNTLDPKWPTIVAPLDKLCDDCDFTKPIVIDIWDYDFGCPHDDFMGFCYLSIYDIFVSCLEKKAIPLQPGQDGHKWGGNLIVEGIELRPREGDSKLDPISPNSILHLVCCLGDADKTRYLIGLQNGQDLVLERTVKTKFTPLQYVAASQKSTLLVSPPKVVQAEANTTRAQAKRGVDIATILIEKMKRIDFKVLCEPALLCTEPSTLLMITWRAGFIGIIELVAALCI
jgi:hypothetical protein